MNIRAVVLALAGLCLSDAALADQAAQIHASAAWIRVLPGDLPAGAYVRLQNEGNEMARLTGASSERYAQVMLHRSSTAGGVGRMSAVDALDIPAHGQVALTPGDYHFMLMQPRLPPSGSAPAGPRQAGAPVRVGDTVRLQLQFADGSTLATDFIARPANALDAGDNAHPHAAAAPAH